MSLHKNSSDDRFTAISNMSPDGIMTTSMLGFITYVNPAFIKLTGFSEKELVGKHVIDLPTLKGRNMKTYVNIVADFIKGKITTTSFQFPYTRKDGSSGIGDAFYKTIKVNGKKEVMGIIKDVTDRKKKEEEYENIFKSSPEGIMHLDLNGIIKNINNSGLKLLEINALDYIGKSIFSIESELGENKINIVDIYNEIMSNKQIDPFEFKLNGDDGPKIISISLSLIKVYDENLGIQILMRDITKQKEIEYAKKLYTLNLEEMVQDRTNQILDNEKMVTLAKISSMMAHDLKGPLQIIKNSLYLANIKPDDSKQYLEYIGDASKQANDLIEKMSSQGKETSIRLEFVNLEEILDESLLQVKTSKTIEFETNIKLETTIRVDRSKILRVFNNLLKNAIESMPNGGKISIDVSEVTTHIIIKIKDTGVGIPEDRMKDLFRPFQSTKINGMGLGLTFCKNTIEAHSGNIIVDSTVGKGTTFTITIPFYTKNNDENIELLKDTLIS